MRNRIRKLLALVVLASVLSLGTAASLVFAGTQGGMCSFDTSQVRLWENPIGDTSDNNDSVWYCNNLSNLSTISHTLPGNCHTWPWLGGNWNDCVDSFTVWSPVATWLCFYHDYNYVGNFDHRQDNNARYDLVDGDVLSSFRWLANMGNC